MQVSISGKQIDVGDALRDHIETRLVSGVAKYFDRALEAQVQFSKARHVYRSDISVHAKRGLSLQAHGESDDIYAAFDSALDRVEKRLRRYKRRLTDHHGAKSTDGADQVARQTVLAAEAEDQPEPKAGADAPVTIAETTTAIHTLTVSEAVMRLELAELPVLMFRHSGNGRLNVVYRRPDGHVGWLDPEGNQ